MTIDLIRGKLRESMIYYGMSSSRKGEAIVAKSECPFCGSEDAQEGEVFCAGCGRRLTQPAATTSVTQPAVEPAAAAPSEASAPIREPPAHKRRVGGTSGLVVFSLGIVLLLATFVVALLAFLNPDLLERFGKLIPGAEGEWGSVLKGIGYAVALGFLLLVRSVGGRIALFGIKKLNRRSSES